MERLAAWGDALFSVDRGIKGAWVVTKKEIRYHSSLFRSLSSLI